MLFHTKRHVTPAQILDKAFQKLYVDNQMQV